MLKIKINNKILFFIFCLFFSQINAQEQQTPVRTGSGYIPVGFEPLKKNYEGSVNIFFGREALGQASITFNDSSDQVILSSAAQVLILKEMESYLTSDGLKRLKAQLNKPMDANSQLRYAYLARSRRQATIFYSHKTNELFVFIPAIFYKNIQEFINHKQYLAQFKGLNFTPALSSNISYEYDKYDFEPYYWSTGGALSSGPFNVIYKANSVLDDYFDDLHLEMYTKNYIYRMGYLMSEHNNIMAPSGNIWGVSATNSTEAIEGNMMIPYYNPLSVYLSRTQQVTISYRGEKLFSDILPAGENIIDTSSFPSGTYTLDIEKKDLRTGVITTTSQMYFASNTKYNSLYSGFQVYAGYQSKYFGTPSSERKPYVRISNGYNYLDGVVDLSYIHGEDMNFLGAEYNFARKHALNYSLSAFINDYSQWYFGSNLNYRSGPMSYQAYIRNGYQGNDYQQGRQKEAGGSISYNVQSWYFFINGLFRETNDYQLESMLSRDLNLFDYPVRMTVSNSFDGYDVQSLFSFELSLNRHATSGNVSVSRNNDGKSELNLNVAYVKPELYFKQFYSQNNVSNSPEFYSADAGYNTPYGNLEANADFTRQDDRIHGSSAGYKIHTNLLLTPSSITFSNEPFSEGFMVNLPYINNEKDHTYLINNKKYTQGSSVFVPKQPFVKSNISITPMTPGYELNYDDSKEFIFPNNVFNLRPELFQSCLVSFVAQLPKRGVYTLASGEEQCFGISGKQTTCKLKKNEKIILKDLSNHIICDSDVVVSCNKAHEKLGKLTCLND